MAKKISCEDSANGMPGCRSTFAAYKEDPPCGKEGQQDLNKCEWFIDPPLFAENLPVFGVLQGAMGQHILGPGVIGNTLTLKPVALLLEAVYKMMEIKRIDPIDHEWCYELIQGAYGEMLA